MYIRIYPKANNTIFINSAYPDINLNKGLINTAQNPIMQLFDGVADSKLIFENEELYKIILALEAQYNITFEYDRKLKGEKLTLTFNQLSANQAAELLSKTLNSKVMVK